MLNKVVKLWPLVVAIVGGIISVTALKYRVDEHELRISRLETSMQDISSIKSDTDKMVRLLSRNSRDDQ